jgi:hypothetical protein
MSSVHGIIQKKQIVDSSLLLYVGFSGFFRLRS